MDEVLGEPITKKGGVADHFGDFGEDMRKQGKKIREAESSDLVGTDGPAKKVGRPETNTDYIKTSEATKSP